MDKFDDNILLNISLNLEKLKDLCVFLDSIKRLDLLDNKYFFTKWNKNNLQEILFHHLLLFDISADKEDNFNRFAVKLKNIIENENKYYDLLKDKVKDIILFKKNFIMFVVFFFFDPKNTFIHKLFEIKKDFITLEDIFDKLMKINKNTCNLIEHKNTNKYMIYVDRISEENHINIMFVRYILR